MITFGACAVVWTAATLAAAGTVAADACPAVPSSMPASAAGAAVAARMTMSFFLIWECLLKLLVSEPCAPARAQHRTRSGQEGCCAGCAPRSEPGGDLAGLDRVQFRSRSTIAKPWLIVMSTASAGALV